MLSFRKLFRSSKSQSSFSQNTSGMQYTPGMAAPMREPLERRRTPYPRRGRRLRFSSMRSSISSGRPSYSRPHVPSLSSDNEDTNVSQHGLPRLLFDPEEERCLAAFEFQADAQWARLGEEEDNILRTADPILMREVDELARRFDEALGDDVDSGELREAGVQVEGAMSRVHALRRRLGI
ncbi:hypothetical protein PENSPDRAFT_747439 [Peniophora sp. CONT]|nr:hypothetical protein PENSPDRAFT_747439 [Peniophora sp. CONT]